ncbi:YheC/YheD family protein [Neobacillus citreus]|uniref:YheC/YheD family protein n=1 Tax=Neobacillus citreus TaxID=2833578 RepID=A0A942Y776_9BACI|nr:YheC/YheD family protein [Neobacillus citreus]
MSQNNIVHIHFLEENPNRELLISRKLWKEFGLNRRNYYIQFGHRIIVSKVIPIDGNESEIYLSSILIKELMIPFPCQLRAHFDNGTLRIGPLVGILMADSSHIQLFEYLLSTLKNEPISIFLFTPQVINWSKKNVTGTFLETTTDGSKKWLECQVPFPNVVYNRIYGRENEQKEIFSVFKKNINLYTSAKMFNSSFFNKDMVYQQLNSDPEIMKHIPDTCLAPSVSDIQDFLNRYQEIFLKPVTGSFGYGIFKVSSQNGTGFLCQYREDSQEVFRIYISLDDLADHHFKDGLLSTYLLQQAIDLACVDEQTFDFRIHLNKDGYNKWQPTAMVPFLKNKNELTTHSGKYTSRDVLKEVFCERSIELTNQVKDEAIYAVTAMESSLNQLIGEVGIDIGIDKNGHIWIFEINSKPSHMITISERLMNEYQHSTRCLSEFFQYLAGYRMKYGDGSAASPDAN